MNRGNNDKPYELLLVAAVLHFNRGLASRTRDDLERPINCDKQGCNEETI